MRNTWRLRATTWALLGAFLGTLPGAPAAIAAPEGERVVKGKATFERDGAHTRITTKSRETIVDYDHFGIAEGESVRIDQPGKRSRILNRVPHGDESRIDGSLSSNGKVYILNPAGVFFGDRAVVRVNELVAGAGSLSNKDFLKGVDRFTDVTGDVGVAAGADVRAARNVTLVGRHVENMGSISSERGMVALVAGGGVLLTRHGGHVVVRVDGPGDAPSGDDFALAQGGEIEAQRVTLAAGDAYSLAMNHTGITRAGEIHVQSEGDGLVQVAGALDASRAAPGEQGGTIRVQGSRIAVQDAVLDASGAAGGGEILVGGDLRGTGDMPSARRVYVGEDATLRADATASGDGGKIIVFADEQTSFYGALSARGGPQGGDGGFAEISGRSLDARGEIDLGAPQGKSGTLLYDPDKIVIIGGTLDGSDDPDTNPSEVEESRLGQVLSGDTGDLNDEDEFEIYESEIEGTNANIVLEATNRIEVRGTFTNDSSTHPESGEPVYEGDGVVVVLPGNSLTLRTTGTSAPAGVTSDNDQDLIGIDLTEDGNENLVWRVSEGGNITISTSLSSSDNDAAPKASISVGRLESNSARWEPFENVFADRAQTIGVELPEDRSITVSAGRGDIAVEGIEANGEDAAAPFDGDDDPETDDRARSAGGGAEIRITSDQGNIAITGPIHARGGDGTTEQGSPGANGAEVTIATDAGRLEVAGNIDVSGGDGRGALFIRNPTDPDDPVSLTGGGAGGAITLVANGGGTGEGELEVMGDLTARGGRGFTHDDGTGLVASQGSFGGALALAGEKTITVGSSTDGVLFDVSGGDGSAGGGSARSNFEVGDVPGANLAQSFRFSGRVDGESVNSTTGEVAIHGTLIARGGNARQLSDDPDLAGGAGGGGGDFRVLANSLDARAMLLDLSGGSGARPTAGPIDPPRDPQGNVFLLGGFAGIVSITGQKRVDIGGTADDPSGSFGIIARGGDATNGVGGAGGSITVSTGDLNAETPDVNAIVVVGDIDVSGGNSAPENAATEVSLPGGLGGSVNISANEKTVGSVLLRGRVGGDGGTGADGETEDRLHGEGAGVTISAFDAIEVDASALVGGAVPDGIVVAGSVVSLGATRIGTAEAPVPIAGTARSKKEGGDLGIATASESIAVEVRTENGLPIDPDGPDDDPAPDALEELHVEMRESAGTAYVRRVPAGVGCGDAGAPCDMLRAAGTETVHTLSRLHTTEADDPAVVYRLDVDTVGTEEQPALAIERGAVVLGAKGGEIINGGVPASSDPSGLAANRGAIEGAGTGSDPHVQSAGTVRLQGTTLGANGAPLVLAGTDDDAVLRLDAEGEIDAVVPEASTPFHGIEIFQFDPAANADVELSQGDDDPDAGDVIRIVAAGELDAPVSRLARVVTTESGSGFTYRLQRISPGASVDEAVIQVDQLDLGGDGFLVTRGDIVLNKDVVATPIRTNGHALTLGSIAGGIREASTAPSTAPSIDMVGGGSGVVREDRALVLVVDGDVGSAATPLKTRGVRWIAGQATTGDIAIRNDDPESIGLHITKLAPQDPALLETPENVTTYLGLLAGGANEPGSIHLTNHNADNDARIVFSALTDGLEFSIPHLRAEDDVRLEADAIEIENARYFVSNQPIVGPIFLRMNDARIVAGGDVVLDGPVRTSGASTAELEDPPAGYPGPEFVHGKLVVQAGGTTTFGGDVGVAADHDSPEQQEQRWLALLDTTAATTGGTSGDTRTFRAGQAHFRGALDGPAAVQVIAQDLSSSQPTHVAAATFDGDIGAQQRLGGFDVVAEQIEFTTANQISATGDVSLDTEKSSTPPAATIFDTSGGLHIQTDGAFTTGVNDKLSVQGPLSIQADSVEVGDVNAARELSIDSPNIAIRARAGAPIAGKDGEIIVDENGDPILDGGTDLIADRVRLSSVPTIENASAGPVRIGVGGGGISAPAGIFDATEVVYFTPGVQHVTSRGMQASDGTVLDLQATGRAVVGNPAEDLPRERALPDPSLAPRYTDEGPSPAPAVDGEQVLAFLRCGDEGGPAADCDAADAERLGAVRDWQDSALATPRAEEIAQGYRAMRARDLSSAFDAAGAGFREAQGFGEFDPAAFARYLEQSSEHSEARAAIHRLANVLVEIELLGLPAEQEARVRRELAGELAAEADLPGFDADAVLLAVEATPIEIPE